MAARKKSKKKVQPLPASEPLHHRFPEDADPSPYHDGRDPDAADDDDDGDDEDDEHPSWVEYKETFYEVVVQYPMEQHRNAQQLRALDEKQLSDATALKRLCEDYARAGGRDRQRAFERLRVQARAFGDGWKRRGEEAGGHADGQQQQQQAGDGSTTTTTMDQVPSGGGRPTLGGGPTASTDASSAAAAFLSMPSNAHASSSSSSTSSLPFPPPPPLPLSYRRHPSYTALLALRRQTPTTASEKVSLASDAYDKTDRHIRTLDTNLAAHTLAGRVVPEEDENDNDGGRFDAEGAGGGGEGELDEEEGSIVEVEARPPAPATSSARARKGKAKAKAGKGKADGEKGELDEVDLDHLQGEAKVRAALGRMKTDPNEPRYCYCYLQSWGKMMGCENDECEREWFHLDCLNMDIHDVPTGKWWCPECEQKLKGGSSAERARKRRRV